jgi:hypothetical protein
VIPFPGTPDASPRSQIIFSSLRPSDIRGVVVTGSSSGAHPGHLSALPDHAGTVFLPRQPFAPGETVTVQAVLSSSQAGTASGAPGALTLNFSFEVAVSGSAAGAAMATSRHPTGTAPRATGASRRPMVTFRSQPSLHPPLVAATGNPDPRSGDIFITAQAGGGGRSQVGPMILNPQGRIVWFRPVTGVLPYNLQVQRYRGQPVLTWWQGRSFGRAEDVILNRSYGTVGVVRGAEQYYPDLHEFQITPRGTALVDSYSIVHTNLTSVGGPSNGTVVDCIIQELDIRTGRLLWEWHALGHVPLTASHAGRPIGGIPYDFFHLNSIQELPGGDLLISARNTWAVYKIGRHTGRILWSLGGKRSGFKMGPGTNFEWQHDARLGGDRLTLFDDGDSPEEEAQSSAKILRIDPKHRTVALVRRYVHAPPLLAPKGGSVQLLPNGNVFVGWGGAPDFSEYAPGGRQLFNATVPLYTNTYRAFRFSWTGDPHTNPQLAWSLSGNRMTRLYVSWNGQNQVARWRVLAGPSTGRMPPVMTMPWRGFETVIVLHGRPHYVAVQALDARGHVLGRTQTQTPAG